MKQLIVILGSNGVGKSTTSKAILGKLSRSAYVDAEWCRAINPFSFTVKTKRAVTDNIYCIIKNYLLCEDIDTIIFPYGFHGERKSIFDDVIEKLKTNSIEFELRLIVLKCSMNENINRAMNDKRDKERVYRGLKHTFHFYDDLGYPSIDTTLLTPEDVADRIIVLFNL